jgi:tetratricopeptide (TPR) repeat protein
MKMKQIAIFLSSLFTLNALGQQDLNTALKLANSQQYEEADKLFQELLAKDPTNGDLYFYYGETLLKDYLSDTFSNSLDEYAKKAEQLFQDGIKQAPTNVLNQVGMGAVTLLRTSDTTKANPYFSQAEASIPLKKKQYTPQHAIILTRMAAAQLYGRVNRLKKAIYYLNWAKLINPSDPMIYLTLGDVYIKQNDASNALFNYNQALNKDPKSPLPKIKIGNIYMRVPNLTAARPYFEEAKQIDSSFAPVYRSLGELYTLAGRHDLAKQNFYKFLQMSGNNTPAKVRYGNSLFRSKDYEGALEVIKEVLQVDKSRNYLNRLAAYCSYDKKPQDLDNALIYIEDFFKNATEESIIPRDYSYYGRILYKLAKNDSVKLDKAFIQLQKAIKLDPSDANLLSELALDYYYARRYKDAIKMFDLKASKGQQDKGDAMLIGKAYYQLDEMQKADSVFSSIISKQPDNMQAYLYLARTYSNMDPTSESGLAAPKFEQLIKKASTDSVKYKQELYESFSYMGYFNLQKKDYEQSKKWYNRLLALDPKNRDWQIKALNSLALISYREKDYVETKNIYQKIQILDPNNPDVKQAIIDLNKVIAAGKK